MDGAPPLPQREHVERKFKAAWTVFSKTCGSYLAPEASYQAWFAHYLISQFGIDRVAREPTIHIKNFSLSDIRPLFAGQEVKLDAVVTRDPGIFMPHYANRLAKAVDGSGLGLLNQLAVISELKVAATQTNGLDYPEVKRDIDKLRLLLHEHRHEYDGIARPKAYLCVLDNHPRRKKFDAARLHDHARHEDPLLDIEVLYEASEEVPEIPLSGKLYR
ncbi:hypothetical protein ACX8Z9_13340 [Arthrobacter halodurans]|uniref:Uncharacterized protein n=1 Tax=Arthrobacter halodurans TaxID=516699 RepID=A0ABV4UV38_9MICC